MTTDADHAELSGIIKAVDDANWSNIFPEERDEIVAAIVTAGYRKRSE